MRNPRGRPPIGDDLRRRIIELARAETRVDTVAEHLGVGRNTVYRVLRGIGWFSTPKTPEWRSLVGSAAAQRRWALASELHGIDVTPGR